MGTSYDDVPAPVNVTRTSPPATETVPDVYADGVSIQAGYAGVALIFNRTAGDPPAPVPVAVVRTSPQQALVLVQLLRKVLRTYESDVGKINLPDDLYDALEIDRSL